MPIIRISILEGKTHEQKQRVVKGITEVCVNEFGVKPEGVRIIFDDMKKTDFAVAGKLVSDN